jgi:hypothetical protein
MILSAMAMDDEAEIRELKRRVGEIEGSVGFLTQQIVGVHRGLLALEARTARPSDSPDDGPDHMAGRFNSIEAGLRGPHGAMSRIAREPKSRKKR